MENKDQIYAAKIFLNSVLPLFKEIAMDTPLKKSFSKQHGIIQISVHAPQDEKWGTYFSVENGQISTFLGLAEKSNVELEFLTLDHFNNFFKGLTKKMPKIRGFSTPALLIATFRTLLKMASLLSAKAPPKDEATKCLVTKLYFYLLSSGISQLNKEGHPEVRAWSTMSPDRVYAWTVDNYPDIAAFLRVKAGNTKSARGQYTRSKPFFTMRFADIDSALGILLQTGDLLQMAKEKKMIMEGPPEFGAQIGDFMMLVGGFAQA